MTQRRTPPPVDAADAKTADHLERLTEEVSKKRTEYRQVSSNLADSYSRLELELLRVVRQLRRNDDE